MHILKDFRASELMLASLLFSVLMERGLKEGEGLQAKELGDLCP